ncbi:MAG: acylphosphatase [Bacteroidota bacterium]
MKEVRAHILIRGFVQGVGFRYFVYRIGVNLHLQGYVRNLVTGEVEIEIEGDRSLVEEMISQVRVGPRMSHITDVAIEWREPQHDFPAFEIH